MTDDKFSIKRLILRGNKNRLARNSFYNLMAFGIPLVMMILFTPMLVKNMGTEGYGLWNVTLSALGLMSVLEFGLGTTLAKYVAEYTTREDSIGLSAVTSFGFLFNFSLGLLLTVPLYFFVPYIAPWFRSVEIPVEEIVRALQLTCIGFLPAMLRNIGLAIPIGLQKYEIPTIVKVAQNALIIIFAVAITLADGTPFHVITSTIVIIWVSAIVSLGISFRHLKLNQAKILLTKEHSKKVVSYLLYTGLQNIGTTIFNSLDRLAVGVVLGLSAVTYYTVPIGIANKLVGLSSAMTHAILPAASSWYASGKFSKIRKVLWKSTKLISLINLALGAGLLLLSKPMLNIWMGTDFTIHALLPFRLLIIAYTIQSINAPAFHIANGIGAAWICALTTLLTGAGTVTLIFVLGKIFGVAGAALANFSSLTILIIPLYLNYNLNRSSSKT